MKENANLSTASISMSKNQSIVSQEPETIWHRLYNDSNPRKWLQMFLKELFLMQLTPVPSILYSDHT